VIDNIDKFPIIILSSPRTGSTFLAEILSKKFPELELFSEPDSYTKKLGDRDSMANFTSYSNISNQYILKCHLKYFIKYPTNIIKKIIKNDAFLIQIKRRNVLDQMVSMYIELIRGIWYYDVNKANKHKENIIPIESNIITKAVQQINEFNSPFKGLNINYDLEIYYEDLINNFNEVYKTNSNITPKPTNHTEIYQLIQKELEKGK
jgi:LPS sulfotransferase NodH